MESGRCLQGDFCLTEAEGSGEGELSRRRQSWDRFAEGCAFSPAPGGLFRLTPSYSGHLLGTNSGSGSGSGTGGMGRNETQPWPSQPRLGTEVHV